MITQLHQLLVKAGEFDKVEQLLLEWCRNGYMDSYLERNDYKYLWKDLKNYEYSKDVLYPLNRGGHQIVVDSKRRLLYMYGGWDGYKDLTDMWIYDMESSKWSKVEDPNNGKWPKSRSCHKMVFDPVTEKIFMLGKWIDNSIRTTEYNKVSDFIQQSNS